MSEQLHVPSIIPHLLANDFGTYFDELLHKIVVANRDGIHEVIDNIIANSARRAGKGNVSLTAGVRKAGMKNGNAPPTYTMRDPKITPTSVTVRRESHCAHVTRSVIEPLLERLDSASEFAKLFRDAVTDCSAAVAAIVQECKTKKQKFFDQSFYFDKRTSLYPEGSPADCTVGEPQAARRLTELFPGCKLIVDGASADDIRQGGVGDCFLIGAISATAANDRSTIERLFPAHNVEFGVYGVVFYKDGGWEWVIVDDFIAVTKGRSGNAYPLYACPGTNTEIWPCILEKAYAKLHYNWDMIDGGWAREAIVDLTGGADYTVDLHRQDKSMTFKQFCLVVQDDKTIVGCAVGDHVEESDEVGSAGESGAVFGLFKGHQYGVLDAKECSDGVGFIKVRNPWGQCEWTGPYSDGAKDWKENPLHKNELNPTFGDDGDFWMTWDDFRRYMTQVDVVETFNDNAQVLTIYGTSSEQLTDDHTFVLQVLEPPTQQQQSAASGGGGGRFTIVVSQDDPKTKYNSSSHDQQKSTPYGVMRIGVTKLRRMPTNADDVDDCRDQTIGEKQLRERSAMIPGAAIAPGLYAITVRIQGASGPKGKTGNIGYFVRVVGPATGHYALARLSTLHKRLHVGDCPPIAELGVANAIAGRRAGLVPASTAPAPTAKPEAQKVVAAPTAQLAAVAAPIVVEASTASTSAVASGGVLVGGEDLQKLKRALEEERSYCKHLKQLYETQDAQLELANKKVTATQALVAQQQLQIEGLEARLANSSASAATNGSRFHDPVAAATTPPSTPWDLVGFSRADWTSLVEGTFEIASKHRTTIQPREAAMGVRSLVTAGLGLDELLEGHPAIRSGNALGVQDFHRLANQVVMDWGFQRSRNHPDALSEEL